MTLGLRVSCNVHEHRFDKRMCLHQVKLYLALSEYQCWLVIGQLKTRRGYNRVQNRE